MHFKNHLFFTLLLSIVFISFSYAQEDITAEDALNSENIENQFDVVIKKSGRYQEYKVVKQVWLNKLKSNTIDTINNLESTLKERASKITEQKATIDQLQQSLTKTNEDLTAVTNEKDSMTFFGVSVSKASYRTIMWVIIGVLILLLAFFIFKFKNSNAVTVQSKKALADLEHEFEDHRRRALEREQKVMRKLQDEINKQKKSGSK